MKTIEELAEVMERVGPCMRAALSLMVKVPATVRPFFHRALAGNQEQTAVMFDRHLALCNALEFALTMKWDPTEMAWKNEVGEIWEPEPDIAFLIAETQVRMARAATSETIFPLPGKPS